MEFAEQYNENNEDVSLRIETKYSDDVSIKNTEILSRYLNLRSIPGLQAWNHGWWRMVDQELFLTAQETILVRPNQRIPS